MPKHSAKVVLGFDFGLRKIGVAIGQSITQSANPLTILKARDGIPSWDEIQKIINDWQAEAFVVGLPLHLDNSEQHISLAARKFARRLQGRFALPVYLVDERYSSREAKSQLKATDSLSADTLVDSYAAKLILESWFRQNGISDETT